MRGCARGARQDPRMKNGPPMRQSAHRQIEKAVTPPEQHCARAFEACVRQPSPSSPCGGHEHSSAPALRRGLFLSGALVSGSSRNVMAAHALGPCVRHPPFPPCGGGHWPRRAGRQTLFAAWSLLGVTRRSARPSETGSPGAVRPRGFFYSSAPGAARPRGLCSMDRACKHDPRWESPHPRTERT